jgi:hypothetical protein
MRLDRTATAAVKQRPTVRSRTSRSLERALRIKSTAGPPSTAVNDFALVSNDSAIGGVARVRLLGVKEPPQGA